MLHGAPAGFRRSPTYTDGMSSPWPWELAGFLLGLLFGSFLNVCIARLPYHESIVKPRSHCPGCLFPIRWYDNIPLVSFIMLRARCRKCHQPIAWMYPLVELAVGLWFAVVAQLSFGMSLLGQHMGALNAGGTPEGALLRSVFLDRYFGLAAMLIAGFLLIGLAVMDWQTHILPDAFTLSGIAAGMLLICTQAIFLPAGVGDIHLHRSVRLSSPGSMVERGDVFLTGPEHLVFGRLLAVLVAGGLLVVVRALYKAIRGHEGMGLGDAKLLAMIAALLGFWPAMMALFVGVISAAVYAAGLLARRRANLASRIPLGSFLAAGGLVAALAGPAFIAWYTSLL